VVMPSSVRGRGLDQPGQVIWKMPLINPMVN
jgi:hypothetical protein